MSPFRKYLLSAIPRAPEDGGGGGAAGGGAGGGGASGGGGDPAGGSGGGSGGGAQPFNGPFYADPQYGFDADTQKFFEGKNYPDVKTALSSLRHADQVARDRNVISKPDPKALKDWSGFAELGWIDNAEKYTAAVPKPQVKAGEVLDEKAFGTLVKAAHGAKLAPWQAEALTGALVTHQNEALKQFKDAGAQANKDLDNALRSQWGDNYDRNTELAKRAAKHFGVTETAGAMLDQLMGSAEIVQLFQRIGEAMGEDRLVDAGGGGGMPNNEHPRAIEAELNRFEQDPENLRIMNDQRNPRYSEIVDQRRALIKKLSDARSRAGGRAD